MSRSILATSCDLRDLSKVPEEAVLANPTSASVSTSHNGTSQCSINPDQLAQWVAVGDTPEVTFDWFGSEERRAARERSGSVHVALLAGSEYVFALNGTLEVFLLSSRRPNHRRTANARFSQSGVSQLGFGPRTWS